MESSHKIIRLSLVISILLLPWQVRWFSEGPQVNGLPWEGGRLSFYLSWLPMLAVIGCALFRKYLPTGPVAPRTPQMLGSSDSPARLRGPRWAHHPWVILILILIPSFFSIFHRATFQWWAEVLILGLFVWSLIKLNISRRWLAAWFVISLVPHAIIAMQQFAVQHVFGSKWLGMAAQDPQTRGVAVIELENSRRVLRAYGGFPHPNIFGGWLAVALPVAVWLVATAKKQLATAGWLIVSVILSAALILTFARSAYIATALGMVLVASTFCYSKISEAGKKRGAWLICWSVIVLVLIGFGLSQRDLLVTRLDPNLRLEAKSINERGTGLAAGWQLFSQHPFIGVGQDATGLLLPIMPHFVPLLVLDEVGLIGLIGLILLTLSLVNFNSLQLPLRLRGSAIAILGVLVVLCLFDHYPWSLWSGRCLIALVMALVLLPNPPLPALDTGADLG